MIRAVGVLERSPKKRRTRQPPVFSYFEKVNLAPKYVTDENGERTEVILPIASYEALLEDLSDLAAIAERRGESTLSHSQFVSQLRTDGLLPN